MIWFLITKLYVNQQVKCWMKIIWFAIIFWKVHKKMFNKVLQNWVLFYKTNCTCEGAVSVHQLHLMLPPEARLVGWVHVLDASKPDRPATTKLYTCAIDCGNTDGSTRVAIEVDKLGIDDTQAIVQWRDDAPACAVVVSQSELVDVAHDGAVGHHCASVFPELAHSPLHDTLGFDASFLVVDHDEVAELHSSHVDPLSALLTVPGGERTEHSRLRGFGAAASVLHGEKVLEDPKAEPALWVNGVVGKLTQGNPFLADVFVIRRAIWVLVHAVPKAKVGAPSRNVVTNNVVGIGDPVCGGRDVIIQQAGALLDEDGQVVLQDVLCLNAVLDEEGATHDVVNHVVFHQQLVGVVDGYGPVEGLVDGAAPDVWLVGDVSHQMPVDGVASQPEGLSCMEDLRYEKEIRVNNFKLAEYI